jgi:hypothetical protein
LRDSGRAGCGIVTGALAIAVFEPALAPRSLDKLKTLTRPYVT